MLFVLLIALTLASFGWTIYVGIRQNRRLRDSEFWPRVPGTVSSVELRQPDSEDVNPQYGVVTRYGYAVQEKQYQAVWTFRFETEAEAVAAHDWLMRCASLDIAYDPQKAKLSVPKLPLIAPAAITRIEPKPIGTSESALCTLLLVLALSGCAASCVINLGAWLGHTYAMWMLVVLHLGVFVVFLPAAAFASRSARSSKSPIPDVLQQAGHKSWYSALATYAIINFFAALLPAFRSGNSGLSQVLMWRAFSGHWIAFYGVAAMLLHALLTRADVSPLSPDNRPS